MRISVVHLLGVHGAGANQTATLLSLSSSMCRSAAVRLSHYLFCCSILIFRYLSATDADQARTLIFCRLSISLSVFCAFSLVRPPLSPSPSPSPPLPLLFGFPSCVAVLLYFSALRFFVLTVGHGRFFLFLALSRGVCVWGVPVCLYV